MKWRAWAALVASALVLACSATVPGRTQFGSGAAAFELERAGQRELLVLPRLSELAQYDHVLGSDIEFVGSGWVVSLNGFYIDEPQRGAVFFKHDPEGTAYGARDTHCIVNFEEFSVERVVGVATCMNIEWESGGGATFAARVAFEALR